MGARHLLPQRPVLPVLLGLHASGRNRSAIFLATSTTGASGSWTNRGLVIETTSGSNYNAIDPNLVVDDQGRWWLAFGSFWTGIKMIRLDPATGMRSTSDTAIRALAQRTTAAGAIEAPFIVPARRLLLPVRLLRPVLPGARRAPTASWSAGRPSITGPYIDRNGTGDDLRRRHAGPGRPRLHPRPGHQAVLADTDGDVLFYHYYADNGSPRLGINLLGWDSAGWPYVY